MPREDVTNLINFERKKICAAIFLKKSPKNKNYPKVTDYCHFTGKYRSTAQSISSFRFNETKEIPGAFHNQSNYDYYFIIKNYQTNLRDNLNVLRETQKSTKPFCSISNYATKRDKDGNKSIYILQNKTY